MAQRLTRHNGRANKNGVYKADHNDRRFDLENADHIDPEMTKFNVYWDCFSQMPLRGDQVTEAPSFAEVEKLFYSNRFMVFDAITWPPSLIFKHRKKPETKVFQGFFYVHKLILTVLILIREKPKKHSLGLYLSNIWLLRKMAAEIDERLTEATKDDLVSYAVCYW